MIEEKDTIVALRDVVNSTLDCYTPASVSVLNLFKFDLCYKEGNLSKSQPFAPDKNGLDECARSAATQATCQGIRDIFSCGIREILLIESGNPGFGIWNTAQGIRNPTADWNPESKFY